MQCIMRPAIHYQLLAYSAKHDSAVSIHSLTTLKTVEYKLILIVLQLSFVTITENSII